MAQVCLEEDKVANSGRERQPTIASPLALLHGGWSLSPLMRDEPDDTAWFDTAEAIRFSARRY